jgi:hypothetical protein
MGFGRILGPWKAAIVIGAVVAALLVSCESRSTGKEVFPTTGTPMVASDLPRTEADARWASAVNALCARRNTSLDRLAYREASNGELASYTSEVLKVWDAYARRVGEVHPPRSYVYPARMLTAVDASRRHGLLEIRKEARAGRDGDVDVALAAFQELTSANYAVLDYIGVPECTEFEPYPPAD